MKRRQRHETNTASNGLVGAFEGSAATIPTATAHRATRPKPCGHSVLIMLCARCWNGGHWPLLYATLCMWRVGGVTPSDKPNTPAGQTAAIDSLGTMALVMMHPLGPRRLRAHFHGLSLGR